MATESTDHVADSYEETVVDLLTRVLARVLPPGVDVELVLDELATEVSVWLAEAYEEGLTDGRVTASLLKGD